MAKKSMAMMVVDVIVSILVMVSLISYGTNFWFDFSIVEWLSFGQNWLLGTITTIVAIVGTIWAVSGLTRILTK